MQPSLRDQQAVSSWMTGKPAVIQQSIQLAGPVGYWFWEPTLVRICFKLVICQAFDKALSQEPVDEPGFVLKLLQSVENR